MIGSKEKLQLPNALIDDIVHIISRQKKVQRIVLFGSWATGTAKKTSDIDLAIFGKDLTDLDLSLIKDELEEKVETALKFDVLHFDSLVKESLKNDILNEGITIYEPKAD